MDINENGEVVETDNEKLVIDAANDGPPPQDALNTTMATAANAKEGGDDNNVGAEEEADDTKGVRRGGVIPRPKTGTTTKTMTRRT